MNYKQWMNRRNDIYSMFCQEEMSNGQVVKYNVVAALMAVAVIAADDALWLSACAVIAIFLIIGLT